MSLVWFRNPRTAFPFILKQWSMQLFERLRSSLPCHVILTVPSSCPRSHRVLWHTCYTEGTVVKWSTLTRHSPNKAPVSPWQSLPPLSSSVPSNSTSWWVFCFSSIPVAFQGREPARMKSPQQRGIRVSGPSPKDLTGENGSRRQR